MVMVWILPRRGHKAIKKTIEYLKRKRFQNKNIDTNTTVILSGVARSGTTWVRNLLTTLPEYSYLNEPLHPDWFPGANELDYRNGTYMSKEKNWSEGKRYFQEVLTGKVKRPNPYFNIEPSVSLNRLFANKLVVKFIRGNRILPWIDEKFDLRCIFLLIRHPCAVIKSQLKSDIYGRKEEFLDKETLLEEVKNIDSIQPIDYDFFRKNLDSIASKLAFIWSVDNLVPLSHSFSNKFKIITYENVFLNGREEMDDIFEMLDGDKVPSKAIDLLNTPSRTSDKSKDFLENQRKQLSSWKRELTSDQIEDILMVTSELGIDLYGKDLLPDIHE